MLNDFLGLNSLYDPRHQLGLFGGKRLAAGFLDSGLLLLFKARPIDACDECFILHPPTLSASHRQVFPLNPGASPASSQTNARGQPKVTPTRSTCQEPVDAA